MIRELGKANCVLHRHGAKHDIYRNPYSENHQVRSLFYLLNTLFSITCSTKEFKLIPLKAAGVAAFMCKSGEIRKLNLPEKGLFGSFPKA